MGFRIGKEMSFFLVILMGCLCSSSFSHTFYVGGKDGWTTAPTENYNHWAERNRFQVNDTIYFKYKKGHDSVLLVRKDDYYKCYKEKPLQKLNDEESGSEFKFERPGPFFFISGNSNHCERGQKLIVVVLSPRTKSSTSPSPSPAGTSPPQPKSPSGAAIPTSNSIAPVPAPANSGGSMGFSFGLSCFVMIMGSVVLFS